MALTLKQLAIKDPESTDIVVLSNIMDGVDGAAAFGWSQEDSAVQIEDMQTLSHSTAGSLDIKVVRALDAGDIATLNGLIAKRAEISGIGIDGFLLFKENPYFNRVPDFNSDILNDQMLATVLTPKGYRNDGSAAFYGGSNALALHNFRKGSATLLNGFEALGSPTSTSVSNDVQTVTFDTAAAGNGVLSEKILCPFVGMRLHAYFNVTAKVGTGGRYRLGFRFLEADGTTIVADSYFDGAATGTKHHEALIPAGAAYVRLYIANDDTTIESLSFKEPMITTVTKTRFVI